MSLTVGVLSGPLDTKVLPNWTTTDVFQDYILHAEVLQNVDLSTTILQADALLLPSDIEVKDVAGLVLFDSFTKQVDRDFGFQVPALGIVCLNDGNCLALRDWKRAEAAPELYESDCSILSDPCALYEELRCCYYKLTKDQQKLSVSFRDRQVRFQPRTPADEQRLFNMMMEAEADCKRCKGDPEAGQWRGGRMTHSCAPRSRRRSCGGC